MKRYEKYKPSGIEWIDEVPEHWDVKRGKFVTKLISGFPFDSKFFCYEDDRMPLIRIRDIMNKDTEVYYDGTYPEEAIVKNGEVLIGMDGDFNIARWKGRDALLNQRVCKLVKTDKLNENYAFYLLDRPLKCINDVTYATTVKHLSTFDIYESFLPVPPIAEQEAIAVYLDARCGDIDKVVATQEKRIALLNEMKQSIITQAVTRGLNPDAKMKDSGVEWIGMVPEHWEGIPILQTANVFIDGDWIESPDISKEGIRYITTGNIGVIYYKEQGDGYITEETFKRLNCTEVFPGDILISRLNEPIGRSCIIPDLNNRIVTSVDNVIYRPKEDLINKQFAVYQMNCHPYTINANLLARGTTMHRISRTTLGKIKLAVPPMEEQNAIVMYLDQRCSRIDKQIKAVTRQIELLREYKQSLVTEVVTGKRKVC